MDQLPLEVAELITSQLKFKEKLQLALTSSSWYHTVKQSGLYSEIFTKDDHLTLWRKIEHLQPFSQISSLTWHATDTKPPSFFEILRNLTNLKHFSWFGDGKTESSFFHTSPSFSLHKLQSICEHKTRFSLASMLLVNNVMPNLTRIEYCQFRGSLRQIDGNSRQLFGLISTLGNAPHLQNLKLTRVILSVSLLEQIDANTSSLKKLHLQDAQLSLNTAMESIFMRPEITDLQYVPYLTLETLIIEFSIENLIESAVLFRMELLTGYISLKYPNISVLELIADSVKFYSSEELQVYELSVANLLSKMTQIEVININLCIINLAAIRALGAHQPCKINSITAYIDTETIEDQLYLLSTSDATKDQIKSLQLISVDPDFDPIYIYTRGLGSTLSDFSCLTSLTLVDEYKCDFFDICLMFVILRVAKGIRQLIFKHGFVCSHEEICLFNEPLVLEELRIKNWTTITVARQTNSLASQDDLIKLDNVYTFLKRIQHLIDAAPNLSIYEFTRANEACIDTHSTQRLEDSWALNFEKQQKLTHVYFDVGKDLFLRVENHGEVTHHYLGTSHHRTNSPCLSTCDDNLCHFDLLIHINQHFVYINDSLLTYKNRIYLE